MAGEWTSEEFIVSSDERYDGRWLRPSGKEPLHLGNDLGDARPTTGVFRLGGTLMPIMRGR
jgi:hypothetical protein